MVSPISGTFSIGRPGCQPSHQGTPATAVAKATSPVMATNGGQERPYGEAAVAREGSREVSTRGVSFRGDAEPIGVKPEPFAQLVDVDAELFGPVTVRA